MRQYGVRIAAEAIVFTCLSVFADSEEGAKAQALRFAEANKADLGWDEPQGMCKLQATEVYDEEEGVLYA